MMLKAVVMIDGGHLRVLARQAGHTYNPDFIERAAHACVDGAEERLLRILYYDCAPYVGEARLPVSGEIKSFTGSNKWLKDLATKDLFAIREGVLKFRGFKPKKVPIAPTTLTDDDFIPDFEQKGVDMRIGLDIAVYADSRAVDRIILVSGDTDCIPALKHGRKSGLQMILASFPNRRPSPELLWHSDFQRKVAWPAFRISARRLSPPPRRPQFRLQPIQFRVSGRGRRHAGGDRRRGVGAVGFGIGAGELGAEQENLAGIVNPQQHHRERAGGTEGRGGGRTPEGAQSASDRRNPSGMAG